MSAHTPVDPGGGLLPDDWAELAPLVDAILEAPPERRSFVLDGVSGGDPERRAVLAQLVAECERDMPLLARPAAERFDQLAGDDETTTLPDIVGDRYRTGHEVGRGGMARVYRARDLKHDRDVAIKVVRAELAAALGRDRFLREIAIAARLRHPNILPLYDSGDANGALYFVMPFEAGPSLRERLAHEGPLPISETVSVLKDVARALQYAHAQGVVHRDIKPDNVLMSGGAAVVADFGIAKAFTVAQTDAPQGTVTQAGAGMGTPAYMAPEQAVGDPSMDHRADIYSFGCLAYELFTGKPPFHDLPAHLVIAGHVGTTPRPLVELRADVPEGIGTLVARCLEKTPAARPQGASDLLAALEHPGAVGVPGRAVPSRIRALVLAGVVIAAMSGSFAWLQSKGNASASPITLSVLPFGNTAADTSVAYLTDGLPDEIASALSRVPGIQIRSRSGARMYRGQLGVDVTEAGARLGADYIMHGVVRLERGQWILFADVARASDRTSIWGEQFQLNPEQQARAVATISENLVAALRSQFPNSIGTSPLIASALAPLANELYLRGQFLLSRRAVSLKQSADMFRLAIAEDTLYAPAYAGLSMALALYPYFHNELGARDVYQEVLSNAGRALELDSGMALARVALGVAYEHNREWDRAEAEFRKALQLRPEDPEALIQYGRHLVPQGRLDEAMERFQAARRSDPASALALAHVASTYYMLGNQDSARVFSARSLEADSLNLPARTVGASIRLSDGDRAGARALVSRLPPLATISYVLAAAGDTAAAMTNHRAVEARRTIAVETSRASVALALGDTARALDGLARATAKGEIWFMTQPPSDPMYDSLRGSERFKGLLRVVGLAARATPSR